MHTKKASAKITLEQLSTSELVGHVAVLFPSPSLKSRVFACLQGEIIYAPLPPMLARRDV